MYRRIKVWLFAGTVPSTGSRSWRSSRPAQITVCTPSCKSRRQAPSKASISSSRWQRRPPPSLPTRTPPGAAPEQSSPPLHCALTSSRPRPPTCPAAFRLLLLPGKVRGRHSFDQRFAHVEVRNQGGICPLAVQMVFRAKHGTCGVASFHSLTSHLTISLTDDSSCTRWPHPKHLTSSMQVLTIRPTRSQARPQCPGFAR